MQERKHDHSVEAYDRLARQFDAGCASFANELQDEAEEEERERDEEENDDDEGEEESSADDDVVDSETSSPETVAKESKANYFKH